MRSRVRHPSMRKSSRRATIIVCVLVCLTISTTLIISVVRTAVDARNRFRAEHDLRQTELLLEAGVQRAAARLAADSEYAGETWELSQPDHPRLENAQVRIQVAPASSNEPREVRVTASLTSSHVAMRRSYVFETDL